MKAFGTGYGGFGGGCGDGDERERERGGSGRRFMEGCKEDVALSDARCPASSTE